MRDILRPPIWSFDAKRGHRAPKGIKIVTKSIGSAREPKAFQFMIRQTRPIMGIRAKIMRVTIPIPNKLAKKSSPGRVE